MQQPEALDLLAQLRGRGSGGAQHVCHKWREDFRTGPSQLHTDTQAPNPLGNSAPSLLIRPQRSGAAVLRLPLSLRGESALGGRDPLLELLHRQLDRFGFLTGGVLNLGLLLRGELNPELLLGARHFYLDGCWWSCRVCQWLR